MHVNQRFGHRSYRHGHQLLAPNPAQNHASSRVGSLKKKNKKKIQHACAIINNNNGYYFLSCLFARREAGTNPLSTGILSDLFSEVSTTRFSR